MTVDTNLSNYTLAIEGYTNADIKFGEKSLGSRFLTCTVEVMAFDSEKIGGISKSRWFQILIE